MLNFLIIMFMLIFIPLILIKMNWMITKKKMKIQEKLSPYECGFKIMSNTRIPFSMPFFLISLMFLIFDIELTLFLPMIFLTKQFKIPLIFSLLMFMFLLILSIYTEFMENMFEWKI